jgi:hypothetical protein
MADLKKVIKALECLADRVKVCTSDCPYYAPRGVTCFQAMAADAIALLKEQGPIKPTLSIDTWICSKCGHTLESQELIDDKENPQVLIHEQYEYCPCCGRAVKWDG